MLDTDPTKSTEELLNAIKSGAIQGFNSHTSVLTIPPFAALLVRLGRDADAVAEKNLRIQRNLIRLTFLVFLISIAMLILQVLQYKQSLTQTPQPVKTQVTLNVEPNKP